MFARLSLSAAKSATGPAPCVALRAAHQCVLLLLVLLIRYTIENTKSTIQAISRPRGSSLASLVSPARRHHRKRPPRARAAATAAADGDDDDDAARRRRLRARTRTNEKGRAEPSVESTHSVQGSREKKGGRLRSIRRLRRRTRSRARPRRARRPRPRLLMKKTARADVERRRSLEAPGVRHERAKGLLVRAARTLCKGGRGRASARAPKFEARLPKKLSARHLQRRRARPRAKGARAWRPPHLQSRRVWDV